MAITLHCPCGKTLHIGDEHAGEQGQCPTCGRLIDIRATDWESAPPTYPAPAVTDHALQAEVPTVSSIKPKLTELTDEDLAESPFRRGRLDEDSVEFDELAPIRPAYKLYSAGDVAWGTFWGGPMGGFVLLSLNYWTLGERRAAWRLFFIGIVIVAIVVGIAIATPIGMPLGVATIFVMYKTAQRLQGEIFESHIARGGEKASGGHAAGIGLLSLLATFGVAVGAAVLFEFMFSASLGEKLNFGKDEVYFTRGATADDAQRLGTKLQDIGYFDGMRGVTVQVTKPAGSFVVVFCQQKGAWNQPPIIQYFQNLRMQLQQDVFNGHPVEIELCDEELTVHRTLR